MEYIKRLGYEFSRLTLGTVQLGIDYGISNPNGRPTPEVAKTIIDSAFKAGITTLDTSQTYGSAEKLIGEYLTTSNSLTHPVIVTKFKITVQSLYTIESVRQEVYKSIDSSLKQLNLTKIPVYLFHKDKEQELEDIIEPLLEIFNELKVKGLIDIAGISAYGPQDVEVVLKYDILEAVQIPINIFDQRLIHNGRLNRLKAKNKIVFARSIYLQGLFFIKSEELPVKLYEATPYLNKLEEIAKAAKLSIPQLAFAYINSMPSITSIVFGAVSIGQVNENIALLETSPLNSDIQELISQSFSSIPEFIITPGLW